MLLVSAPRSLYLPEWPIVPELYFGHYLLLSCSRHTQIMTHGSNPRPESLFASEPVAINPSGSGHAVSPSTVDQSRPDDTGDQYIHSTSSTRPLDSPSEDERLKLLTDLESSVKSFRKGSSTKTEAISSIL
ncbi:hypothetical protein BYT27DRAFT_7255012 [Phlegmacium glaucopus]|nr:hypothetical protein BYT27DRAFT_7255012 [Phlegmacium glaucopus]